MVTSPAAPANDHAVRVRAGRLSLLVGGLVFSGKLAVYELTGSTAVFSDAMESVVNVAAGALLLYSLVIASRPADRDHPYGHGKVEFFSAGVEGALIAMAAGLILFQATRELILGPELRRLDVGAAGIALLTAVNALLGLHLIRVGRRTRSDALVADGHHLLTDVLTSVAVVVGLIAVQLTGLVVLDPLIAIAVALNILRVGWRLLRGAVGGLMDEADESLLAPVCSALDARRESWWIDIHSLRTWRSGAIQHTDLHVAVPRYFDADRLHRINHEVSEVILGATGHPGDVIIHFDPCRPRQCASCAVEECPVREKEFQGLEAITLERAVRGDERLETGEPLPPGTVE